MTSILIGTPTTRESVFAEYASAVACAASSLTAAGVRCAVASVSGYDVAQQRDVIATEFLKSDFTHLLFWDSDIGAPADLALTLLKLDKPLIGALYPFRSFNFERLEALIKAGVPAEKALSYAHNFAVLAKDAKFVNDIGIVDAIGAGFLLIRREVFEAVEARFGAPISRHHNDARQETKRFFTWRHDVDGTLIPEDWGFCSRWRECGGQVWAYSGAEMSHAGTYVHRCNAGEAAKALRTVKPE